ncbi:hypothetical protein KP509_25G044800 [Ceratopteris richardii]|uniref:histone acetyltransferase n=1 Tax=Ceratopteris richardii TaxID=49495 RepID=A0A8T2RSC6_CERRI|nr:hypothetical protein KP509_25G044800 [Ceratopteris richardii]
MQRQVYAVGQHGQFTQGVNEGPLKKSIAMWQKPWHSNSDLSLRKEIFLHITKLMQKNGLQDKLPTIANEFELALYSDADSKDDYANLGTLEHRICSLFLRVKMNQKVMQHGALSGSGFHEKAHVPACNVLYASAGAGKILPNNIGQRIRTNGVPTLYAGSQMIPTPGVNTGSEANYNLMDGVLRIPPTGLTSNGMLNCAQIVRPDHMLMNINSAMECALQNQSGNAVFIQGNSHSTEQLVPHQQFGIAGGNSFISSSIVDNLNSRNFQNSSVSSCVNSTSVATMTTNSYSSFLSNHSDAKFSQHSQAQYLSQSNAFPNSPTISVISQEYQDPGRTLVVSNQPNCDGSKTFSSNAITPLTSSIQAASVDALSSQQDTHQTSYLQQHNKQQHQWQLQEPQHFQPQSLSFEDKQKMWLPRDAGNASLLQFERNCSKSNCPQVFSIDQQSEMTCQASSADTGQSEVVSNGDSMAPSHDKCSFKQDQSSRIKQQQWLLLMFWHVSRCKDSRQCSISKCEAGRIYWKHITSCRDYSCRCTRTKLLLRHHSKCRNPKCVICAPVRSHISPQALAARCKLKKEQEDQHLTPCIRAPSGNEVDSPPTKKLKVEIVAPCLTSISQQPVNLSMDETNREELNCSEDALSSLKNNDASDQQVNEHTGSFTHKIESPTGSSVTTGTQSQEPLGPKVSNLSSLKLKDKCEGRNVCQDTLCSGANVIGNMGVVNSAKKKVSGITYLECLSSQQIREHICSLRKWIGQSKAKAEKNQAMELNMSASACSACAVETLHFDPIPVFCSQCGSRIKRNAIYYASGSGDSALVFCSPCFSATRSDVAESDGIKVQKSALEKKRNDEQRVEAWVECDKCKKWQHQVCALFNARINKERTEYVCPDCCIAELERGERVPRPRDSVLGAKDLPRTMLSDFVEERLVNKLRSEREERAKAWGRPLEEVPTAEGLVVRVISSVDKKLEVKPRFLKVFQQEAYPKEFMYKSKMLMLFQEIEGVEVCLFGMYVQEFGAECQQPNSRHVYLSYLDSVKYFRPDVKAITGEALRTYVYHEILVAYLDYCKRRGFSSCYIWACPPLKGDDYILYCHPEIQKTPKPDKLREWYLSMISKAKKENIVTANRNLFDYYFTSNEECKAKVTAARLPYFDGDYWPGAAEDILQQLQEEEDGVDTGRRTKMKKTVWKRTTKTSTHGDNTGSIPKDVQLMDKLGQLISAMKEDFIMVHMHHACSRCRNFIISGIRWVCESCQDNFQLCAECHAEHEQLSKEEKHPAGKKESHLFIAEKVEDAPSDTQDRDEIMECEYFDNRQAFLSLCQGNQYQYDTLRRAKHSSMMILYHLHNPDAPAFVSSCTSCQIELEPGQGWKCNICTDYDVCNDCYRGKDLKHPHKLVPHTIPADQNATSAHDRQQRVLELRMILKVLVHSSNCKDAGCQFSKCKNLKDLFRHGNTCVKRATGGCPYCKRIWFLLSAHARSCKESICNVPRCGDIRRHLRRIQQQQESRRRAAFNEMIRQRKSETAGDQ